MSGSQSLGKPWPAGGPGGTGAASEAWVALPFQVGGVLPLPNRVRISRMGGRPGVAHSSLSVPGGRRHRLASAFCWEGKSLAAPAMTGTWLRVPQLKEPFGFWAAMQDPLASPVAMQAGDAEERLVSCGPLSSVALLNLEPHFLYSIGCSCQLANGFCTKGGAEL